MLKFFRIQHTMGDAHEAAHQGLVTPDDHLPGRPCHCPRELLAVMARLQQLQKKIVVNIWINFSKLILT